MVQMCSGSILTKWRSFVLTGANVKWDLICSLNRSVFKSRNYDDSARDFFRSSTALVRPPIGHYVHSLVDP